MNCTTEGYQPALFRKLHHFFFLLKSLGGRSDQIRFNFMIKWSFWKQLIKQNGSEKWQFTSLRINGVVVYLSPETQIYDCTRNHKYKMMLFTLLMNSLVVNLIWCNSIQQMVIQLPSLVNRNCQLHLSRNKISSDKLRKAIRTSFWLLVLWKYLNVAGIFEWSNYKNLDTILSTGNTHI